MVMDINTLDQKKLQMRKGLLEFCILLIINEGKVYSSDILRKLKEADLLVVEGTLYPLLSRLRAQGLLDYQWEESKSGPPRKYFELTKSGQNTLNTLQETWTDLQKSISKLEK